MYLDLFGEDNDNPPNHSLIPINCVIQFFHNFLNSLIPGHHLVEQLVGFLFLVYKFFGSFFDNFFQIVSVFLKLRQHIVHYIDVAVDRNILFDSSLFCYMT